ncbi:MAG: 3-deoxy-manno-octulosonate cytidylyltransferase [Blastocatellia bacterium]|nr:3-deoxy-manno-octulosonate cytidylyltransferase [Blastocatellia bacterium]
MKTLAKPAVVALIPARYASSRFPGKPLVDLCGQTMIHRVYERARQATHVQRVIVATDDDRIVKAVRNFGGEVVLTDPNHATGTDRLAEVAARLSEEIIVNLQGDEPLIAPSTIDAAIAPLLENPAVEMSTTCEPLPAAEMAANPNIVKVVCDQAGFALYFSRSVIPFVRDPQSLAEWQPQQVPLWFKHTGLYVYRRELLLKLAQLPPVPLEKMESLEQLRALYYGHRIKVVPVEHSAPGVDTPEDAEKVRNLLRIEN